MGITDARPQRQSGARRGWAADKLHEYKVIPLLCTDLGRRRSRDMRERRPLWLRGAVDGDGTVAAPPMKRRGWSSEESLGLGHKKLGPTNLWAALWLAEPKGFSKEKLGPILPSTYVFFF